MTAAGIESQRPFGPQPDALLAVAPRRTHRDRLEQWTVTDDARDAKGEALRRFQEPPPPLPEFARIRREAGLSPRGSGNREPDLAAGRPGQVEARTPEAAVRAPAQAKQDVAVSSAHKQVPAPRPDQQIAPVVTEGAIVARPSQGAFAPRPAEEQVGTGLAEGAIQASSGEGAVGAPLPRRSDRGRGRRGCDHLLPGRRSRPGRRCPGWSRRGWFPRGSRPDRRSEAARGRGERWRRRSARRRRGSAPRLRGQAGGGFRPRLSALHRPSIDPSTVPRR